MVYFKERGVKVDLLSLNGFTNRWSAEARLRRDFFETVETCDWKPSIAEDLARKCNWKEGGLPNHAIKILRSKFQEMRSTKRYDFLFISYVYWADLVEASDGKAIKIIDLHDFITLNLFLTTGKGRFRYGKMFQEEINAISKFDVALSISEEEMRFLSPFCPDTRFVHVPIFYPPNFPAQPVSPKYDLLFVGSENPFNREGMKWFMGEVYPLLDTRLSIAVVGKICNYLETRPNLYPLNYVENLENVYRHSRVVFCPLRSGTGLKVKTVEALSFGLPVVTTPAGLDGISRKVDNGCWCAETPSEFAGAIHGLLNDVNLYRGYSEQAKSFFSRQFSKEIVYSSLDRLFSTDSGTEGNPQK
jgi:glycosyltransferase involved in cell wall biosynthesis